METETRQLWDTWLKLYITRLNHETNDIENNDANKLRELDERRRTLMNATNPAVVLRNHLAEEVIKKAENGSFEETKQLLAALEDPYSDGPAVERYTRKPTKSARRLKLSCSS